MSRVLREDNGRRRLHLIDEQRRATTRAPGGSAIIFAMHFEFLQDLVVVLATGIAVVLVSARLRMPAIVGFLATGTLLGPHGLALVNDRASVELLAEVGVIVLLFTIGAELSLSDLTRGWRALLVGGTLQVVGTAVPATLLARAAGLTTGEAILVGFAVALSSTAIVLRLLGDRAETTSPHGRVSLGILVYQDLAVVPMMLVVPFLAGGTPDWPRLGVTLLGAAGAVAALLLVARRLVPRLLEVVVAARSPELFLLSILVVCLGTAWLTSAVGLSLALGAFLAGLVISESEYSHQALGVVLPFRDVFLCLFFVSAGMLLDVRFALSHLGQVAAVTAAVLLLKAVVAGTVARVLGFPTGVGAMVGLLLAQIGEFSFLLIHAGNQHGLLVGENGQVLLVATVLTMAATPALATIAPRLSFLAGLLAVPRAPATPGGAELTTDHVIIVGYGLNGQNVAHTLRTIGMRYVILEVNPETVKRLKRAGEPIHYGSATQPAVLKHAGIERARVVVVTIPDAAAARQVVAIARGLAHGVHIIVRTRFVSEVEALFQLGANDVVPEEFETSIELFSRVLRRYLVPRQQVEALARETREAGYSRYRAPEPEQRPVLGLQRLLAGVEMEAYAVEAGSRLAGRTLIEGEVKRATGALVLAVHRGHQTTPNPPGDFRLEVDDVVLVLGSGAALARVAELFRADSAGPDPGTAAPSPS